MGLKGHRLWVMGQLYFNVQSPTSYFFISSCRRIENCDGNSAGKYRWMKEKINTWPAGKGWHFSQRYFAVRTRFN
jgi:hypothetical protein